ncbi:MAG: D-alanyl-D-alanine carboxypeptidase/D-alanyl-D-alanine-endopeptidase, partial [Opitutaceae bacterium]|nr:D-alanyl-D-alanine carboxypeptidase/D-alanyl-D-alanine-endopeptidase [Opitutaceae bacterium]
MRISRQKIALLFLLLAAGFADAADTLAPPPPVPPAATLAGLRAQVDAHVLQPRFEGALWSVKVVSLETGRTLYEHQPRRLMSPASNSKLYTGALALGRLGGDYRIKTPVLATAAPDAEGVVAGHVIVSGRGDPGFKSATRRGDFWKIFDPFVAVLRQAGVRRVTGDLVADGTHFRGPGYGAGWVAEDLIDDYGAEFSALTLEQNFADLRVTPAAVAGQPARLELLHPQTGLVLVNRTVTGPAGGSRSLQGRRRLGEPTVYVLGELPVGGAEEILDVTVPQPARWFAAALQEALRRAGISVEGQARAVSWPDASPVGNGAVKLGDVASAPLRELVAGFMKPSQNLETDLIFAHVAETTRPADAPEWRTSEQLGVAALGEFLRSSGLPADEVRFDEGSGLSRNNLASANATVALLAAMAKHAEAKAFRDSLPVAGIDGTIRRRMKGTAAEGNVRAKTGTLRWANGLSGYVTSAAGEAL